MNFDRFNPRVWLRNGLIQPSHAEIKGYLRQEHANWPHAQEDVERLHTPSSMKEGKPILERIKSIIPNGSPRPDQDGSQ